MLNCLITHKEPERIKSQNFGFTKSLVDNLYKRASLTHQSPTTKTGKQVSTVLLPTLTITKKIHRRTQPTNQMASKLSDPNPASSQERYPEEEGVNPSSALPQAEAQPEHMEHFRFLQAYLLSERKQ